MTVRQLVEACTTETQALAVIETTTRLGTWPDDFVVDRQPFELPDGYVYVITGARKGRAYHFGVSPEGVVSS